MHLDNYVIAILYHVHAILCHNRPHCVLSVYNSARYYTFGPILDLTLTFVLLSLTEKMSNGLEPCELRSL